MKTIDLLVQALPAIGGWPEKVTHIGQDYDRELIFYGRVSVRSGIILDQLAVDHRKRGKAGVKITREQYEAALAAKNDGWIEWGGGKCPLHNGAIVDVKLRNGREEYAQEALSTEGYASYPFWRNDGAGGDIIAYRLHQQQEADLVSVGLVDKPIDDACRVEEDLNDCIGHAPVTQWNGEGLPPVGMEIEYKFAKANYRTDFSRGKVLAYGMHNVFMEHWASKNEFIQPLDKIEFRPIRSESERKRDEAGLAIYHAINWNAEGELVSPSRMEDYKKAYDAIASGKIPGIKLED